MRLRDLGFEDGSWKNDAAARATKRLPNRHIISVWVDYDDPDQREFPETTRYGIQLLLSEDGYGDPSLVQAIGEFDDATGAKSAVQGLLRPRCRAHY